MSADTLLSTREVADRLGVSVATITRRVSEGLLSPAVQAPGPRGAMLFTPDEVARYEADR